MYPEYLTHHYIITLAMFLVWICVYFFGQKANHSQIKSFTWFLIILGLGQEIFDFGQRFFDSSRGLYDFSLSKELPLHPCHFAYFSSLLALYTRKESYFYIAYFFGMSGAFMGIVSPGVDTIYNISSNLTAHFQHSIIILNLAWCLSAFKMRCTKESIFFAFKVLNLLIVPIFIYNSLTGENFFFLREAPALLVYNPLLPTTVWPWYIFWIEMIFIPYCYLIYLPVKKD
jgi:hypothetical integral membrane protein (TIGR02206 family)